MQALTSDADGDGIGDASDNCPFFANVDQRNTNGIGPGDACELSLVVSRGLLKQYARFGSYKELVLTFAPLSFTLGPDLMRLSAPAPKSAFVHLSLLTEKLGVRSPSELFPGAVDAINGSEVLRVEVGSASQLGGAKASEVWLRLDGSADVSVKLFAGNTAIRTLASTSQGTAWKRFAADGALFDAIELRVVSGRVSIRGGGEAVLFALARATLPCPAGYERSGEGCVDIDECAGLDHLCDPLVTCTNTDGSFVCGACPPEYRGDGLSGCRDIDECAEGSAGCSTLVTCSNTSGGYLCGDCPSGYRGDGHTCTDTDECAEQTDSCDPLVTCTNTLGSYECGGCPSGYVGGGQTGCSDVDECSGPRRVCDALVTCNNLPGGFECGACPTGYRGTGATSCVDIDECAEGTADCSPLVTCGNTPGAYQCGACPNGYAGDGRQCTDLDECALGTDQCSDLVTCQNTAGGYSCGACPSGYAGDGQSCTDIDECAANSCDPRVRCQNTLGGYTCGACPAGFTGDGYAGCVDVDECNAGLDDCSPLVTCGNTLGGYTCSACPAGYSGDGHSCADVDECAVHTAECDSRVTCTNTEGSYTCGTCPQGFTGDGRTCTDIDECVTAPCDALTNCTNAEGSYRCSACPDGYAGDGYAGCVDIDECAVENGGCAETDACTNTPGSRTCTPCATGTVGIPTSCGVGACAAIGITLCQRGQVRDSCSPGTPAADDASCEGVDSDCDGQVDEDYLQQQTSCGVGACARSGLLRCVNGQATDSCQPGSGVPSDASCDGVDSDCDGQVDEEFTTAATHCGVGGCQRTGHLSCAAGQTADSCEPGMPAASDATCDASDNDCDGTTDEEFVAVATSCGQGACQRFGLASCVQGQVVDSCTPGTPSGTDECNGFDDDCDGLVDEDFIPSETTCGTGACAAAGSRECVNGAVVDTCAVSAGTVCDDGDACNGPDNCSAAGVCQPSSPGSTLCCDGAVFQDALARTPIDPTVITSFPAQVAPLYEGAYASQWPVAAATISPQSVTVIRGRVLDESGAPLPCVAISAWNAPQYGTTRTRADGTYLFAVNGGTQVTIRVELPGYISARRAVDTVKNRYVSAQDVRLMTYGTPHAVSAGATTTTVVEGELETDQSGSRRATLLFPTGTTATVAGESTPRQAFEVRVKEVTNLSKVGRDGMPATLPVQSAFTYAVSLAVAGAEDKDVVFNRPVPFYVENFLGFPNGETVPAGRWDDKTGQWVAEETGRVISIVSVDETGRAMLDVDKTPGADDPTSLGVDDAERRALAARYAPGTSLWRVRMGHFSMWDINWGWGPPDDASPPPTPPPGPGNPPDDGPPCGATGSVIECESRVLREHIPIAATPYELVYSSARQPGSARELRIPVSGATLPSSLESIVLHVEAGGRIDTRYFAKTPQQTFTFDWDGTDVAGRLLRGPQMVRTRLGYTYPGVYKPTSVFGYNGNGTPISGDRARFELTLFQVHDTQVGHADASYAGLGGWTLSSHHVLEPKSQTLYLGDGGQERIPDAYMEVTTVAGTGQAGRSPDGTLGTAADLYLDHQSQIAVGPDGSVYFVDAKPFSFFPSDWKVRKIGPDGVLQTINGGPNLFTHGVTIANNTLYYDNGWRTIVKRDLATGAETFVAEAPAQHIRLSAAPDGSLFILELAHNARVWRFRDGAMEVIATDIRGPKDLVVHPDGSVIVASGSRALLRIAVDRTITRIAGTGSGTSPRLSDGAVALEVDVQSPQALAIGPDGLVYFSEHATASVYRINPNGRLERVIGTGTEGTSPDGTPAARTALRYASAIALAPDGALYIHDQHDLRIRRTRVPPRIGDGTLRIVPSREGRELFAFDKDGRHLWTADAYTGAKTRTFGYDSRGLLQSITDRDGRATTIERDANGSALAIIAPDGQRTELHANGQDQLAELVQPDGGLYTFGYTSGGLLTSMKDPKAHAEDGPGYTFEYERGKLVLDRAPTGGEQTLSESASATAVTVARSTSLARTTQYTTERIGQEVRRTVRHPDATTAVAQRRLDVTRAYLAPNGRSYDSKVTRTDGSATYSLAEAHPAYGMGAPHSGETLEVMPSGLSRTQTTSVTALSASDGSLVGESTTTSINGRTTTITYDGATRTFVTTTPAGRRSTRVMDASGRVARIEPPGVLPIEYVYDGNGRLHRVIQGERETAFTYGSSGQSAGYLASSTNAIGETTVYTRDALGRVLQESLPDAELLRYRWDGLGNMTGLTPPGKPEHAQTFDSIGQQLSYEPPVLAGVPNPKTGFEYNLDRQLTGVLRPDGVAVGLSYEDAGKLDVVTTPFGNYDYDYYTATCSGCAPGKQSRVTSPSGVALQFTYDGALLKSTSWSGPITGTLALTYDNEFRVSAEAVNASVVRYGFDADSLVTCASMTTCSPAGSDALRITWDPVAPRITGVTLGATRETRTYNAYGELASIRAMNGSTLLYAETLDAPTEERDALGRIVTRTETTRSGTLQWKYEYDTRGRLALALRDGELYERVTYDANGNRIRRETPDETIEATYDTQDRLLSYGPYVYTYTTYGELRTKTDTRDGALTTYTYDARGNLVRVDLPDATLIEYVIDGLDRRVTKKKNGVVQKRWLYRDQLRIAAELDGDGNLVSRFVYAGSSNVPDFVLRGGVTYRVISDHLGSTKAVVHASDAAQLIRTTSHDAWGVLLEDSNPEWMPFGFAGGLYDPDTGLIRFGVRDYDPTTGRWTAKDPIMFEGGQANLFVYAGNGPVNRADPSGLFFCNLTDAPIKVGGTTGRGHGHTPGQEDGYREGYVPPGRCVGGDFGPLETPDGPLYDVDAADWDSDGAVDRAMSKDDLWPFGDHTPWGDDRDSGICAVDFNPWLSGSTPWPILHQNF